jgi:hypothetical protein
LHFLIGTERIHGQVFLKFREYIIVAWSKKRAIQRWWSLMDPSLFLASVENLEIGDARFRKKMKFTSSLNFSLFLLILLINFANNFG